LILEGLDARQLLKGQVDLLDGINVTGKSHLGASFLEKLLVPIIAGNGVWAGSESLTVINYG
jgi:hypothetical protein